MEQATVTTNRRLERGTGPIGGVAAGLADYFAIDPTIVRLGLVATTLLGGPTIPIAYVAAWIIIPAAGEGSPAPAAPAAPAVPATPWADAPPPPPGPEPTPPPVPAPPPVEPVPFPGAEVDQPQDTVDPDGSDAETADQPTDEHDAADQHETEDGEQ